MIKILVWIFSADTRFFNGALKILERQHNGVELVGMTSVLPVAGKDKQGKDLPRIPHEEVAAHSEEYDILLVAGGKRTGASEIIKYARRLNFDTNKMLFDWIVCVPGFTIENYRRLQRSRLTIFAKHCFGGHICHTLGLPFRSPFVNLYLEQPDFIRFLRAPRVYMEEKLVFKEMQLQTEPMRDLEHAVFTLGNIDLHFNHYDKTDEEKFDERRKKINWYNLFVTMYTEDEKILREFDELPYGKKVCFVPFKSDLDSAWYINPAIRKNLEFWNVVNHFAKGEPFYYDPFDMLLYGKKTQLIEM